MLSNEIRIYQFVISHLYVFFTVNQYSFHLQLQLLQWPLVKKLGNQEDSALQKSIKDMQELVKWHVKDGELKRKRKQ